MAKHYTTVPFQGSIAEFVDQFVVPNLPRHRLEGKRACRIGYRMESGGWKDEEQWPEVIERSMDAMIRLNNAMNDPMKALRSR